MGPLFAFLLFATVAGIIAFVLFVLAALFLPWRLAFRMALSTTIGSAIGFAGTLFVQIPFYPSHISSTVGAATYLIIATLGGITGAVLCAMTVWRISR